MGLVKQVWATGWWIEDGIASSWSLCCAGGVGACMQLLRKVLKAVKRHNADASPTEWERGEEEKDLHNSKLK